MGRKQQNNHTKLPQVEDKHIDYQTKSRKIIQLDEEDFCESTTWPSAKQDGLMSHQVLHKKIIQIDMQTLEDIIEKHSDEIKKSSDWITPFSVFLTCMTTLLFSSFHDVLFLSKDIIQALFLLITVYFFANSIYKFWLSWKNKDKTSIQNIMQTIRYRSEGPIEKRLLFVIITKTHGGKPRILLYKDVIWDCWFLPNISFAKEDMYQCKNYIAGELGVPINSISLEMFPPNYVCFTRKISRNYKVSTDYWNQFCFVKIKNREHSQIFSTPKIEISGRTFKWMTTTEMMNDPRIREINMDIVQHLHDKCELYIYNCESLNLEELVYGH